MKVISSEKLEILTKALLDELLKSKNIERLTSNAHQSIIADKIRYFSIFFIKALEDENHTTLFATLPWMYHAYNAQGFQFDFFLVELDAWQKVIENHFDALFCQKASTLLEKIRQRHEVFITMAGKYHSKTKEVPDQYKEKKTNFQNALLGGDINYGKELFLHNATNYDELQNFYEYIIVPSMHDIGIAWENGEISAAQEHLASSIVLEIIATLYTKLEISSLHKGKIIVGAIANEFHAIGSMMLANSLESDGWDVDYLGENVNDEIFLNSIYESSPDIVALSVAMPFNIPHVNELIDKIDALELEKKPKIMLGGSAFYTKLKYQSSKVDSLLKNVDDGVKQANIWYEKAIS